MHELHGCGIGSDRYLKKLVVSNIHFSRSRLGLNIHIHSRLRFIISAGKEHYSKFDVRDK